MKYIERVPKVLRPSQQFSRVEIFVILVPTRNINLLREKYTIHDFANIF